MQQQHPGRHVGTSTPKLLILGSIAFALAAPAAAQGQVDIVEAAYSTPVVAPIAPERLSIVSSLPIEVYGYLKADASYDTGESDNGNFTRWVPSGGEDDGEFNITARQTRLGMRFFGPETETFRTTGLFEVDFFDGSGTAENNSEPRMRHAYVNLDFKNKDMSLLAGETSDVISPLVPSTINYTVAWWSGDVGFRRNQVRLTKGFQIDDTSRFEVILAATRSPGGEDAGGPGFQGRMSYSFPGLDNKKTTIGVSGHSARERNSTDSDSVSVDVSVPLTKKFHFKGEFFSGQNLDAYAGGIGQGVNGAGEELESTGYWAFLSYKYDADLSFGLGFQEETMDDDNLDAGFRETNSTAFINGWYSLDASTKFGLEIAQHETGYFQGDDESSTRFQASLLFKF